MESENTIKEIKLDGGKTNKSTDTQSKIYSHDKNVALILLVLGVFCFVYDVFVSDVKTCLEQTPLMHNKILIIIITFLHHLLAMFGLFGWMFNNKKIVLLYLVVVVITMVQWKLIDGHCVITDLVANISGNKNYTRFNDLYRIIGYKKIVTSKVLYHSSFLLFIVIALYKIFFT